MDYFTIDRNGGVAFDDRADSEEIKNLIETLDSQGFTAEPQEVEASEPVGSAPRRGRWAVHFHASQPFSPRQRCRT